MTNLSADRPGGDPSGDLYNHAPFARMLADSIMKRGPGEGLVLALHGPWGSGKSTVLNYVRHYIGQEPKNAQPIIVTFNPWWFSGQENLARAFMSQLRAVLPAKNAKLKKLGTLIGEYAESIGGFADLTGKTLGAGRAVGKVISQDTALLTRDDIQKLQTSWLEGIRASKASLLTHSHLPHLLTAWKE